MARGGAGRLPVPARGHARPGRALPLSPDARSPARAGRGPSARALRLARRGRGPRRDGWRGLGEARLFDRRGCGRVAVGRPERVARQGFFLTPVYRRRERNHAHLMLLVDQGGSMVPLHRFSRDLIETALYESNIEQVEVFYFHNILGEYLYSDPHLTKPIPRDQVSGQCTSDTSVLIVSDAGATRGHRRLPRIQATTEALFHLKQHTALIAWLNPMPQDRWTGTSAQIIAHLVPMFQMDLDGFNNAIDVVRGQPFHHYH